MELKCWVGEVGLIGNEVCRCLVGGGRFFLCGV